MLPIRSTCSSHLSSTWTALATALRIYQMFPLDLVIQWALRKVWCAFMDSQSFLPDEHIATSLCNFLGKYGIAEVLIKTKGMIQRMDFPLFCWKSCVEQYNVIHIHYRDPLLQCIGNVYRVACISRQIMAKVSMKLKCLFYPWLVMANFVLLLKCLNLSRHIISHYYSIWPIWMALEFEESE